MAKTQARKKAAGSKKKQTAAKKTVANAKKVSKAAAPKAGSKYVYLFGRKTDGNGSMKALLGGKGANLGEMCRIGLPVPPGFTVTTGSAPTTTPTRARIRRSSRDRWRPASPPSSSRPARPSAI